MEALNILGIILQFSAILALTILTYFISKKYHGVYMSKSTQSRNKNSSKRPVSDKTLTQLLVSQILLNVLGLMPLNLYFVFRTVANLPWCLPWIRAIYFVASSCFSLALSSNFLIYIGISGTFRKAVVGVLACKKIGNSLRNAENHLIIHTPIKQAWVLDENHRSAHDPPKTEIYI